jgi:hypothetical protein
MGQRTPIPAAEQLQLLNGYAENYKLFTSGAGSAPIAEFGRRIASWDAAPTHSLVLRVAGLRLPDDDEKSIYGDIMSYLVRRALCGLTAKNYNNVFLQLLKHFRKDGATAGAFRAALAALDGTASRWPRDDEFRKAWMTEPVHSRLGDIGRIRTILAEIENGMRSSRRSEEPFTLPQGLLDVDHIMPDRCYEHWPLNGGSVTEEEANSVALSTLFDEQQSPRVEAIVRREQLKATFGNLTLVHYGVNRSLQHSAFDAKRNALFRESTLQLNRELMQLERWDEDAITQRGRAMFDVALQVWPGP